LRQFFSYLAVFLLGAAAGGAYFGIDWAPKPIAPPTVDLSVADGGVYRVRKVVDGDTLVLENGAHVRYHGVNTPEAGHFVKDAAPLSAQATARNVELVEGKRVRLKLPREPLDMHGRIVATVLIVNDDASETDAGKTLLQEGLAKSMGLGASAQELSELKRIEEDAKARKAGIWGLEDNARKSGEVKPFIAASTGSVYHLRACGTAQRIRTMNLHEYDSAESAEAAGYKPCSKCINK
jgi:micrococcal nuclease